MEKFKITYKRENGLFTDYAWTCYLKVRDYGDYSGWGETKKEARENAFMGYFDDKERDKKVEENRKKLETMETVESASKKSNQYANNNSGCLVFVLTIISFSVFFFSYLYNCFF